MKFLSSILALAGVLAGMWSHAVNAANPTLAPFADNLGSPVGLVPHPDGKGRLVVVDQLGTAYLMSASGAREAQPFLDLSSKLCKLAVGFDERGFLSVAFHPQFKTKRKVYAFYTAPLSADGPADWDHTQHISEFTVNADGTADPASERLLLAVDHPNMNHNCGRILFGPDGYLYIGIGDGGGGNGAGKGHVAKGNSQDLTQYLGKILRIDVDNGKPYGIPSDNPVPASKGKPEIFAWGLRNPWGISFDRGGSHELFAVDVGQSSFEELNLIVKGGNYGWPRREGFSCFDPANPNRPPENCPDVDDEGKPFRKPLAVYKNFGRFRNDSEARGTSVTGGYIYRGKALPQLVGKYIYADWSRSWGKADGSLFVATRSKDESTPWVVEDLELASHPKGRAGSYIVALGEDADGELYVMSTTTNTRKPGGGKIARLVPE